MRKMRIIDGLLPLTAQDVYIGPKNINAGPKKYLKILEYLFKNPKFYKRVMSIREKFKLPASGIKDRQKNGDLLFSLELDDETYKTLKPRILKRNKHEELNGELKKLADEFDLPTRFIDAFRFYVIYNKFPDISNYLCRSPIRICDDRGIKKVFIEIYADTILPDLKIALDQSESVMNKHELKGKHLRGRKKNHYMEELIAEGSMPVDENGIPLQSDKFYDIKPDTRKTYRNRAKVRNSR